MKKIDLSQLLAPNTKVISGREYGKTARKQLNIDLEDKSEDPVEVYVASDIFSLTSSYFLGLFGKSVRKLGEDNFRKKYIFICEDTIRRSIDLHIKDALKKTNVLDGEDD